MEDKEAIDILIQLMDKQFISAKEKKAVRTAIGVLSWTKLAQGRMKNIVKAQKAKRDKSIKW